jgi:hypothetical protein
MFRLYIPCYCGHTAFVKNLFMASKNKDPERSEDLIKGGKEKIVKKLAYLEKK